MPLLCWATPVYTSIWQAQSIYSVRAIPIPDTLKAIYFFEVSVLFETGELNAYVYDGGGLYRRKYVRTEGKGRTTTIALADGKLLPCIATRG